MTRSEGGCAAGGLGARTQGERRRRRSVGAGRRPSRQPARRRPYSRRGGAGWLLSARRRAELSSAQRGWLAGPYFVFEIRGCEIARGLKPPPPSVWRGGGLARERKENADAGRLPICASSCQPPNARFSCGVCLAVLILPETCVTSEWAVTRPIRTECFGKSAENLREDSPHNDA
jgi:hypothetical protein